MDFTLSKEEQAKVVYELYRDVYGHRPNHNYNDFTLEEISAEYKHLIGILNQEMLDEEAEYWNEKRGVY